MTTERDQRRERWRVAALEAATAEDRAARLKDGREIFLSELIETLLEHAAGEKKLSAAAAERMARTSAEYRKFLRSMHDARARAVVLRIECENLNRVYWEGVSQQADYRAEMRMTGAA